jgi:hypothetical protein
MIFETGASPGIPQELDCPPEGVDGWRFRRLPDFGMSPGVEQNVSAL